LARQLSGRISAKRAEGKEATDASHKDCSKTDDDVEVAEGKRAGDYGEEQPNL
jgi:hypothetical protein